jgi:hypothetical protein
MVRAGISLPALMKLMGHAHISTTIGLRATLLEPFARNNDNVVRLSSKFFLKEIAMKLLRYHLCVLGFVLRIRYRDLQRLQSY